jgi:hypothetical protein
MPDQKDPKPNPISLEFCTHSVVDVSSSPRHRHPKITLHLNCECDPEQRTLEASGWVVVPTDTVTFHARFLFVSVGCYLNNAGAPVEPTGTMPVVRCTSGGLSSVGVRRVPGPHIPQHLHLIRNGQTARVG